MLDPQTGLYYYRARYYSPKLGRYLQTDPIGQQDDVNLFVYVGNDPLNQVDPKGLCRSIKNEAKRTDCLEKRANAVAGAKAHLAGQSVRSGTNEAGYIATYNEDTGEVSVRTGDAAGNRSGDEVIFTDNDGNELVALPDGRIRERGDDDKRKDSNEIVLATGHGHTGDSAGRRTINPVDNANRSIGRNPVDKDLSRIAPAVIKTPYGQIKVFQNKKEIVDD